MNMLDWTPLIKMMNEGLNRQNGMLIKTLFITDQFPNDLYVCHFIMKWHTHKSFGHKCPEQWNFTGPQENYIDQT